MASSIDEINKIKKDLEDFYKGLRTEQEDIENYYQDKFAVPLIQQPYHIVRSGRAAHLVDSPAEHIMTSNPQVYVEPRKQTEEARLTAIKQAQLFNHWVKQIKLYNPDPLKEFIKNQLRRGEAFYQILFNEDWDREDSDDLPILLRIPDPLIIWAHPAEKRGVPKCVIVKYKRMAWAVESRWPEWKGRGRKEVEWVEYWDDESRYFEADGKPVFAEGIQENIYGFVPFVHAFSGFGKSSPDGKPESLSVSIIHLARSLLLEECTIRSILDSIFNLYAHPTIRLETDDQTSYAAAQIFEPDVIPGAVLTPPPGVRVVVDRGTAPEPEMFAHLGEIESRIDRFLPPIMQGMATSSRSSGRLEDILGKHAEYKYDTVIENAEKALSVALNMGRQMMIKIPKMLPITINATVIKNNERFNKEEIISKEDLVDKHKITVHLAAANPVESDRQALLYRMLFQEGIVDWETCLIKGFGETKEEAQRIIKQVIADQAVLQNPEWFSIIMQQALQKMGMSGVGQVPTNLPFPQGVAQGQPRNLNIQTPTGFEQADLALAQRPLRQPPRMM